MYSMKSVGNIEGICNMAKVYTKTGDKGETSLVGGQRVKKNDARIKLYGLADELNSFIGVARSFKEEPHKHEAHLELENIQNIIFDVGSVLACLKDDREKFHLPHITITEVTHLEQLIDQIESVIPKLTNFILPGGSHYAANLHVCRTICRRFEIELIDFLSSHPNDFDSAITSYFNRLSDYLFVLARLANHELNIKDVIWKKRI